MVTTDLVIGAVAGTVVTLITRDVYAHGRNHAIRGYRWMRTNSVDRYWDWKRRKKQQRIERENEEFEPPGFDGPDLDHVELGEMGIERGRTDPNWYESYRGDGEEAARKQQQDERD